MAGRLARGRVVAAVAGDEMAEKPGPAIGVAGALVTSTREIGRWVQVRQYRVTSIGASFSAALLL